jgi:hypothetical protein
MIDVDGLVVDHQHGGLVEQQGIGLVLLKHALDV